jgi:hypothetical protein
MTPGRKGEPTNLIHGGASGIKDLQHQIPLRGLAAESQRQVEADLEEHGRAWLVGELAVRVQAVGRLFWNAICASAERAQEDDSMLKTFDGYCNRYVWLANSASRLWEKHRSEEETSALMTRLAEIEKLLSIEG